MNIRTAIHRLAESGAGRVKTLQDKRGEKRLRAGDYRVRFTGEVGARRGLTLPHNYRPRQRVLQAGMHVHRRLLVQKV